MSQKQDKLLTATCRCGKVEFEAAGAPIVTCTCYCASCQEAGRRFDQLSPVVPLLDPDGGTGVILWRKDRVRCVKGEDQLVEHRLTPESATRRVIANCCGSPMFLEFTKGHWLTMYKNCFQNPPPIEMRVVTKDRRAGVELPADVPNLSSHSGKFMVKLLAAWIAMGFRTPEISWGRPKRAEQ